MEIISPQEKDEKLDELADKVYFERKANIHGACVKLLTDNKNFKEEWEDNFKFMNEDIRPHAKVFTVEDGGPLRVFYEPLSKTSIILNCDYYGWVKSIALATIADFFEDYHSEHRRYSVHGSAVDCHGQALAIIGPPGTGKTTLTYGLLLNPRYNYVSDDWFFTRIFVNGVIVYSSEKNSYIRDDIADSWDEYKDLIAEVNLDKKKRGIADVNRLFNGRIRETSNLKAIVLLERDLDDEPFKKLTSKEALNHMKKNDFCNPHQLIKDERKYKLRLKFFKEIFHKIEVYLLNTIETPKESLERIKNIL
ncbi:MAG: hypothetical protein H5T37_06770 [Methanobacteriaceae archaeon]|nr:hypothetical protein [Methanobacteriaceae archaeon]